MRRIVWILIVAVVAFACSDDNFTIEGKITNSESPMIYLEKLEVGGTTVPYDSSKIDGKGNFKLKGNVSYPTFFYLRLNKQKLVTLLIDSTENVKFSADYINYSKDYRIEGSIGSQEVKELNTRLAVTNSKIDSIRSLIAYAGKSHDYEKKKETWINEIGAVCKDQASYSIDFINKNPFSLASVLAIYQRFSDGSYVVQDLQSMKMAASALYAMYPKSVHTQALYRDTEKLVKDIRTRELKDFIDQYGTNSPDISLPDLKGNEISLSSLRGKYVLLQFWSALDRSSRIQNAVLKENYQKFNRKGFEIYQVSIDTVKTAWQQAIAEDGLKWTNVGDLSGSIDALNKFNISKIPSNYLLDKEGTIIAKDVNGPALYKKLSEILN